MKLNVDAIYVISLHKDKKRRNEIKNYFKDFPVQFFLVHPKTNPEHGCYDSHERLILKAKKDNYKKVLIMEDDARPRFKAPVIKEIANKAMAVLNEKDPNWRLLMLGYLPFKTQLTEWDFLLTVQCAAGGFAYIVNVPNIQQLPKYKGTGVDIVLFCNSKKKQFDVGNILGWPIIYNKKTRTFKKLQNFGVYATRPMLISHGSLDKSNIDQGHLMQRNFVEFYKDEDNLTKISTQVNTVHLAFFIVAITLLSLLFFGFLLGLLVYPIPNEMCRNGAIISFLLIITVIIIFTSTSL